MSDPYATTHEDWDPPDDAHDGPTPDELAAPRLVDPRTQPWRFHHLRAAGMSGKHALLSFQPGQSVDTLERRLGAGTHAMMFGKPWALWDKPAKSGKGKAKRDPRSEVWQEFCRENAGAVIMNAKELERAKRIADAVHSHGRAEAILFAPGTIHERTIRWSQNGIDRQSTPDARLSHLAELKTTTCALPWWFMRHAEKMYYHAQLADQRAAIKAETGQDVRDVYIVAVENKAPWCVTVIDVRPSALQRGEKLLEIWLERLQVFAATEQWGDYTTGIEPWELLDDPDPIADPDWMTDGQEASSST